MVAKKLILGIHQERQRLLFSKLQGQEDNYRYSFYSTHARQDYSDPDDTLTPHHSQEAGSASSSERFALMPENGHPSART